MNDMAKIFWSGRSQAVRLPKEYRFDGDVVRIRRQGNQVILEAPESDDDWAKRIAGSLDEDFARAVLLERPGPDDLSEGPSFD